VSPSSDSAAALRHIRLHVLSRERVFRLLKSAPSALLYGIVVSPHARSLVRR